MDKFHNSCARKGEKEGNEVKGEYGRYLGKEEEGNAVYGGMVQASQHITKYHRRKHIVSMT